MATLLEQNKRDVAQYETDFTGAFESARDQEALDFATKISAGEKPATAPGAQAAEETSAMDSFDEGMAQEGQSNLGVGRDISLGVIHAPRSVVRGVRNGVQNMIGLAQDLHNFNTKLVLGRDARIQLPELPEVDKPETPTVTGDLIEAVTQFAVGFKGIDKLVKANKFLAGGEAALKGIKGGKTLVNVLKGAGADLAAFDEQDERLSNVIQQVPALQNPVTEFLAADPDDGFAEGKLKQAIEGLTIGALGDVVFDGVKLLRKGKAARKAIGTEKEIDELFDVPVEEQADVGLNAGQFEFLGDADDANFLRKKTKMEAAEEEVQGAFGKPKQIGKKAAETIDDYEINFARINAPEDIKQLMDDMVNKPELKISIEAERRGKIDNRTTLTAATDIDGFDELMKRRTGDAFNAETIVAARKTYYDTTTKLMDAAKRAASAEASDIDQFNFRKMVAVHHAVQKEFMGVRAEAGRALQAWSIPVAGSGAENLRALEQVLNEFGGAEASKALAKRLAAVGNNLNTSQINAITQKATAARTIDAVTEAWTLGLLTNPTTHVVNLSSNVLTGFVLGIERLASAGVKGSPVTMREGGAYFAALLDAQKMAIKNMAEAFRTGQTGIGISKLDLPRTRATSRDILDPDGKAGIFSKAFDYYGSLLTKYAGGALAAGDEYSKTVLYQAQLRALATRDAITLGLEGQALKEHVARVIAEPPAEIRADAVTFANYGTFTKELGSIGQSVQRATAKQPLLRFVLPFVRTPANIFKFTFERTPLAPLSQKVRDDIAAGGVRRAAALSKIGVGTSIMAIGADLSQNGLITGAGPSDPNTRAALKRTGWQPYSVKIGDTWYSYARFEPVATVLGMSADLAEILSNYEAYDVNAQLEADELATAMAIAVGNQAVGKTFLRGFADLVEALSDPGRYGEGFLQRFSGSFVPAGVAAIERAADPVTSQVFNFSDAVKSRIPGMSGSVIPKRNIWGDEIKAFYPNEKSLAGATAERLLSLFNPVYYSAEKDAPVDSWMLKNGFEINMPEKVQVFDGVRIDLRDHPKIYDRLVELRGSGITLSRYGNQNMKEFFGNLVTEEDPFGRHIGFFMAIGNNFDDQQNFISQVVRDYTAATREQLLEEFPELSEIIGRERRNAEVLKAVRPPAQKQESAP